MRFGVGDIPEIRVEIRVSWRETAGAKADWGTASNLWVLGWRSNLKGGGAAWADPEIEKYLGLGCNTVFAFGTAKPKIFCM